MIKYSMNDTSPESTAWHTENAKKQAGLFWAIYNKENNTTTKKTISKIRKYGLNYKED